jgi:anti-anti-sigma regulatory factor
MDNTELLDSQGLSAILSAHDLAHKQAGNLKIATSNPVNRKILEITRLDQQLDVFDSVIDAVKSFRA